MLYQLTYTPSWWFFIEYWRPFYRLDSFIESEKVLERFFAPTHYSIPSSCHIYGNTNQADIQNHPPCQMKREDRSPLTQNTPLPRYRFVKQGQRWNGFQQYFNVTCLALLCSTFLCFPGTDNRMRRSVGQEEKIKVWRAYQNGVSQ